MSSRYCYFFKDLPELEKEVGDWDSVLGLLGGKGANVAKMASLEIPVPDGFTITTKACIDYNASEEKKLSEELWNEITESVKKLEEITGKRFGDQQSPLLVSCRSGAKFSMPGMMDTVLNIGLNDRMVDVLARLSDNPRFAYDSYRRLVQGYGAIVMGVDEEKFEHALDEIKKAKEYLNDADFTAEDWKELVGKYKDIIKEAAGEEFPQDPIQQIKGAVMAVLGSWNSPRAKAYRDNFHIDHNLGTAVNIMVMVFGNMGDTSATGVSFSRDPKTGAKQLYGEYLVNAQGEDVVAGIRNATPIEKMAEAMPEVYKQFTDIVAKLEQHYKDVQDIEFTIENGKLWILQTRNAKRTPAASIKIAVDLVEEKLIEKEEAVKRVDNKAIEYLMHPFFASEDIEANAAAEFGKGTSASPGSAVGQICITPERANEMKDKNEPYILVRPYTKPDDVPSMIAAKGVATMIGGTSSHAAVITRQLGVPCIVGCTGFELNMEDKTLVAGETVLKEGDWISIDGTSGTLYNAKLPMTEPSIADNEELKSLLKWADAIRAGSNARESIHNGPTRGLRVFANADTAEDAKRARNFGAEGIGLCRTEHMFLGDRTEIVRRMIIADNDEERNEALEELEELQVSDFASIFEEMTGLPTIIRLIDPPLHEFLPDHLQLLEEVTIMETRKSMDGDVDDEELEEKQTLLRKVKEYHESNPMIGFRGVRLCLLIPGLLGMQLRAIIEGACIAKERGSEPIVEIMIPLTSTEKELEAIKPQLETISAKILKEHEVSFPIKFGTMIEVPRAAIISDKLASIAEFFSFGTNDLHQLTFGYSRDDAERSFLTSYYEKGILSTSPFSRIDEEGVGRLMEISVTKGRSARSDLSVGICGEHGGDPESIAFCHKLGMDYVSCSPFRVPVARFAAAKAVLK